MNEPATASELAVAAPAPAPVIAATGLAKSYVAGDGSPVHVLNGVELEVRPGEVVAVIGESGSGKSTLLYLLGGLDTAGAGRVEIGGEPLHALSDDELGRLRNRHIGFVFQFHHLLREFTAIENVMMPQLIAGTDPATARARARELLASVGLSARADHKSTQLSGGEQQRVAVARALANRPTVLLADEPTGNLDTTTSAQLHDLLFEVSASHGCAMVLVTHDMHLAARADRILSLEDGRLVPVAPRRPD